MADGIEASCWSIHPTARSIRTRRGDLFSDPSWFCIFDGMGVTPVSYDPLLDVVRPLLGGVELGGTKCICILGTGPEDIREQVSIATLDPATTLRRINSVLDTWSGKWGPMAALGLASFGPLDLRPQSPRFGQVTSTA